MSDQSVVAIEEALAKAYVQYTNLASEFVSSAFHNLDFVQWVHDRIKPTPEWTQGTSEDLAHLHRLIKTADVDSAQEIVKSTGAGIMSFKSFVEYLVDICEGYGDVQEQEEAQG